MERVTDARIWSLVHRIQKDGIDISLDGQYGRWRVTNKEGSRDLSPRASNREIMDWLWAYQAGWEAGKEFQFNKMRKEADTYLKAGDSACAELVERVANGSYIR